MSCVVRKMPASALENGRHRCDAHASVVCLDLKEVRCSLCESLSEADEALSLKWSTGRNTHGVPSIVLENMPVFFRKVCRSLELRCEHDLYVRYDEAVRQRTDDSQVVGVHNGYLFGSAFESQFYSYAGITDEGFGIDGIDRTLRVKLVAAKNELVLVSLPRTSTGCVGVIQMTTVNWDLAVPFRPPILKLECFMSPIPSQNRFPAEIARTLGYLRHSSLGEMLCTEASAAAALELASSREEEEDDDDAFAWFRGESRWWKAEAPLRGAREFHERTTTEHVRLLETSGSERDFSTRSTALFPMLVAHDLLGERSGQAKMYAALSWARLLCYVCTSFRVRYNRVSEGFAGVPSRSVGVRVPDRNVPKICFHGVRSENAPVHALMLDFDFPDPRVVDYAALFSLAETSLSRVDAAGFRATPRTFESQFYSYAGITDEFFRGVRDVLRLECETAGYILSPVAQSSDEKEFLDEICVVKRGDTFDTTDRLGVDPVDRSPDLRMRSERDNNVLKWQVSTYHTHPIVTKLRLGRHAPPSFEDGACFLRALPNSSTHVVIGYSGMYTLRRLVSGEDRRPYDWSIVEKYLDRMARHAKHAGKMGEETKNKWCELQRSLMRSNERCANNPAESDSDDEWSFEGPVFQDKRAHARFFEEFLHPLLKSDPWYAERALRIESFLDPVHGATSRTIGMAKWEAGALSRGDPRYSRIAEPMRISDSLATRNFVKHRAYAIGRMMGIFTDVPIPTVYWDEASRLRVIGRREEIYDSLLRERDRLSNERIEDVRVSSFRSLPSRASPMTVSDSEFAAALRFAAVSTLHALGVSPKIAESIEIDPGRITVCKRPQAHAGSAGITVLAYQTRRCRFYVERNFEAVGKRTLRIGGWPGRSEVSSLLTARTGSSKVSEHTDGGKMYFVYRFGARESTRGRNLLAHFCWKCMGREQFGGRDRLIGTIPRQAVRALRRMVDELPMKEAIDERSQKSDV
eukprot:gene1636-2279_t